MAENENLELEQNQEQTEEKTTYTKEEFLQMLQSETDKRVQQALKTQQKKHDSIHSFNFRFIFSFFQHFSKCVATPSVFLRVWDISTRWHKTVIWMVVHC